VIDANAEVAAVELALRRRGNAERAEGAKAYLKIDLRFLGVDAAGIRATAREVCERNSDMGHDDIVAVVRALWDIPCFDMRAVGVGLLERRPDLLGPADLDLLEGLLRRSKTWALVDWLSTKVTAPIVSDHPGTREVLRRWSRDDDFWIRRSSMLSLLPDLRAGEGDFELFASVASQMIEEREFFIRKAIGWVLRETAKKRPELVFRFLGDHVDRVAVLTLREGSKYLPAKQREELLARYRRRR
jgi:3-methyladenine DNA glycosylase AlkD